MKGAFKWPIVLVAGWRVVVGSLLALLVTTQDQDVARQCVALVERLLGL